ncbi:LysR family transcriptional regulator [Thioclava sp. SK-1]|uniref:LysR family transcriptional regulator n=1 Tax=Thioclava sp. SK-1 TaxID=1889770 RepID=UPI0008244AA1|nr:LysR family transcriptional regulator [Thioclava sp. SK-1]OCX66219.1 LysR family transcriptional regulator [Thioclava sp. SK-1]
MIGDNLRHLRVFRAVCDGGSATRAAESCLVSQPAVTQALGKLEAEAGMALFFRRPQGFFPTQAGEALRARAERALAVLDAALEDVAPRLVLTATRPQLMALIASVEAQNFSLAARRLGVAQPTVHRAVTQLEREAGRALFQRSSTGILPTRSCNNLARAARLSFAEMSQARAELGDLAGREVGQIVIGAMPLGRSHPLPHALVSFRKSRPNLPVRIVEGTYDELLGQLRRGDLDFLIGALRDPVPIEDVVQEWVFDDTLVLLCGGSHPWRHRTDLRVADLADQHWLVPRDGTPTRSQFDAMFTTRGLHPPHSIIETGSVILMREVLDQTDHLACISWLQAKAEIARGLVHVVPFEVPNSSRAIGLTLRRDWTPTPAQSQLLNLIRKSAQENSSYSMNLSNLPAN